MKNWGNDFFTTRKNLERSANMPLEKKTKSIPENVVSDSEEGKSFPGPLLSEEIIVISSSSEAEEDRATLDLDALPRGKPSGSGDEEDSDKAVNFSPLNSVKKTGHRFPSARRIIESSESEDFERHSPIKLVPKPTIKRLLVGDIVEITSSEDEVAPATRLPTRSNHSKPLQARLPPYLSQEDGGAILQFAEPKHSKNPLRVAPKQRSSFERMRDIPNKPPNTFLIPYVANEDPPVTGSPSTPASRSIARPKSAKSTTRVSQKSLEQAEQARREKYAQDLFDELNALVFKNRLPEKTKLNWNKRLLTTAGKAKYRRSRDGVETSEIELATKILDCEERIRNTLSHEMCHLATWVIDKKLDENHGKLFKYWASKITHKRPDIEITTRHAYEISYPYKWECEKCHKIYGRYSQSIRPDECVCGACRTGRLIPLFTVKGKALKMSQLTASNSQDSPYSLPRPVRASEQTRETEKSGNISDIDSDIESLTMTVAGTRII